MTNFEFYKDKIMEVKIANLAMNKETNTVCRCSSLLCDECAFARKYNNGVGCEVNITEFLYAEHKEQPKLTKKERAFCELVGTGYIARDSEGSTFGDELYYYCNKPLRREDIKQWYYEEDSLFDFSLLKHILPDLEMFKFITWEDEEPWKVEDLLKLEVIE